MHPWDESEYEPDWDGADPSTHQRDAAVDQAKITLRQFFGERPSGVFYQRQLQVIFEGTYFHWITAYALSELAAEGYIASEALALSDTRSYLINTFKPFRACEL